MKKHDSDTRLETSKMFLRPTTCENAASQDATNKKDAKPGPEGGGAAGTGGRRLDKNQEGPKASFPFGVKKSELSARSKGGAGGKSSGSKHRVDNELNIIKKYMKGDQ